MLTAATNVKKLMQKKTVEPNLSIAISRTQCHCLENVAKLLREKKTVEMKQRTERRWDKQTTKSKRHTSRRKKKMMPRERQKEKKAAWPENVFWIIHFGTKTQIAAVEKWMVFENPLWKLVRFWLPSSTHFRQLRKKPSQSFFSPFYRLMFCLRPKKTSFLSISIFN